MRRKKLQNSPNQLCQMFCGWQLHFDKPKLAELGNGLLEIDVKSGRCSFNGSPIEQLSIAKALQVWLSEELVRLGIADAAILRASLSAGLKFSKIPWRERSTGEQWFRNAREVTFEELFRCAISCRSEVATDELVYAGAREDVEECPSEWLTGREDG